MNDRSKVIDKSRLLQTFLDITGIDSPSRSEGTVAAYCKKALEEAGCSVEIDDTAKQTDSDTGNLIATLPGVLPGTIAFSAHMDCVEPATGVRPVVRGSIITSETETVLGGDDKVGIAASIETIRTLAESGEDHPTIKAIFTVQEEVGLRGAKVLDPKHLDADLCLVLDGDGAPGSLIVGAPFQYTFTAAFKGVAAHAGAYPEKGVSAIAIAADAITHIPIGRIDETTTANVGTITGGAADNIVAEECVITGECRSLRKERVEEVREQIESALHDAASQAGQTVDTEWSLECDGFLYDKTSSPVKIVSEAVVALGLPLELAVSGGASDANIFAGSGVPVLVLGTGMKDIHSTKEWLSVEDLEKLTNLLVEITRVALPQ